MRSEITLDKILALEDTPELLAVRCPETRIPLWTTVRFAFLRTVIGDLLYETSIVGPGPERGQRLRAIGKVVALGRAVVHNAGWLLSHRRDFPVLVMATGGRVFEREGRFFNSLSDHFTGVFPEQTVAIESMFEWRWAFPRHHRNTLVHTPTLIAASRRGARTARGFAAQAQTVIDIAAARAKDRLGWTLSADDRKWLTGRCAAESASLAWRYETYRSLFRRLGARLVVKEEACYGGADNAAIMLAARHLGIRTAEYQHGLISAGHDGYNFAAALRESAAFADILPESFLTYGSWWGSQINAPVAKIAVGHPHRSETLRLKQRTARQRSILVLGDLETDLYLELCGRIARACAPEYKVVFRPHPLARSSISPRVVAVHAGRVVLDANADIYDSFLESEAVVGEVSTGLFEAIGLVDHIFVWDTAKSRFAIPIHPFTRFTDAAELPGLLADPDAGQMHQEAAEAVWAPQWQANYVRFIEGALQ